MQAAPITRRYNFFDPLLFRPPTPLQMRAHERHSFGKLQWNLTMAPSECVYVLPTITSTQAPSKSVDDFHRETLWAMGNATGTCAGFVYSAYDHFSIQWPKISNSAWWWAGLASAPGPFVWLNGPSGTAFSFYSVCYHELGHK